MAELFPGGRCLLCNPHHFDVIYEINAWMDIDLPPDKARAQKQWTTLHHTLIRKGVWVEYVNPLQTQPDMVFTANAGLVRDGKAVLAKFRYRERQGEAPGFEAWFRANGFEVHHLSAGYFEGEGDALYAGDVLFGGYGFRTERDIYPELEKILGHRKTVLCEMTNSRFYHLDTCFCPLDATLGFFYPGAFTNESAERMSREMELFEVPVEEALRFACNSVVIGKNVVMPAGCPRTMDFLRGSGFTPYPVEVDEYLKAGGAAKCLVLKLTR